MKISNYIQPTIPTMPTKSFKEELQKAEFKVINDCCKYRLPCGWCEKRNEMCVQLPVACNGNVAQKD